MRIRFAVCVWMAVFLGISQLYAGKHKTEHGWHIVQPKNYAKLKSGELFITVKLDSGTVVHRAGFEFFLDDYLITSGIKFMEKDISILYKVPLKAGKHKILIKAKADGTGWLEPLQLEVEIMDAQKQDDYFNGLAAKPQEKHFFEMTGVISGDYKSDQVTGAGSAYRQTPPYISDLNVNTITRIGQVSIPVKVFTTSDEYMYPKSIQSRNYYQVGLIYKRLELTYGDMNPDFDRTVLPATRVTGYRFAYKSRRFQFQAVDGYLQRPMEGYLLKYSPAYGLPPTNLRPDSTYIVPGTYRRRVYAVQFGFGNRFEGAHTTINLLKAKDEVSSIQYGLAPKDNLVAGIEQSFITPSGKTRITGGVSMDVLTNDISGGPSTKHEMDSALGSRYAFDPKPFKDAVVMNVTTVRPGWQDIAGFVSSIHRLKNQTINFDYSYYGSAYTSLANPFVRNDLETVSLQDQLSMWKRRIIFTARGMYQFNNLSGTQYNTMYVYTGNGALLFMPSPKLPQFNVSYFTQYRNTPPAEANTLVTKDRMSALNAGILYNLQTGSVWSTVNFQFNNLQRADMINSFNSNSTNVFNAALSEQLTKLNLIIDLRYTTMIFSNQESGTNPTSSTYDGRIRYEIKKLKTFIGMGYYINKIYATGYSNAGDRKSMTASISTRLIKNTLIEFETGLAPYREYAFEDRSYDETYAMVRLTHNLNIVR